MLADVITAALVAHRGQPGVSPLNPELHDLTSACPPRPIRTRLDISVGFAPEQEYAEQNRHFQLMLQEW